MQWAKLQTKIFKALYTRKVLEKKLQTDNAFLNATHYHYLIGSLGLILKDGIYIDQLGQGIKRKEISSNLEYHEGFCLEQLSKQEAIDNSSYVGLIRCRDDEEFEITVTYTADTKIRAYLGEEEIPPLLLGYEILNLFISNLTIAGYILLQGDLTRLGLMFKKGVMGQTRNIKELRNILYGDESKEG